MSIDRVITLLEQELAGLTDIASVYTHPKRKEAITLPAMLIDLAEIEPGSDRGTEETPLRCHWEVRVVTSDRDSPLVIWRLVQSLLRWLFIFEWRDTLIGKAQLKSASPDHFSPEFHGHRVWLIEFSQEIRVGDNVWAGDPPIVESITVRLPNCDPEPEPEVFEVSASTP